jgi:hypothetical protein
VLVAVTLLAIASLRYAPMWREQERPHIAMVSEVMRPPAEAQTRRSPPSTPRREVEPQEQSAPAPAPTALPPSEPVMITTPTWIERPRHPERWFPRQSFMQGIAGEVVLYCEFSVDGLVMCCGVETPTEQGFMMPLRSASYVMRPAAKWVAVRGRYRMDVPFTQTAQRTSQS